MQKSEEKEGNKRRKKRKENIVWERRETGRKGKKEGRGGLAWRRQDAFSGAKTARTNESHNPRVRR